MLTFREAKQRLQLSNMTLSRVGGTLDFRVQYAEARFDDEHLAYTSDDLEDAMLTGMAMRRKRPRLH